MNKKISFTIIAHVDHGKSTLSDRILEVCGAKDPTKQEHQVLDSMDLERKKGITIKLQSVRLNYDGSILTLIDTPGHADFSYEVHRSLLACENSILLVDATQGIQAQTLAHLYKAIEYDHTIIPVLNKIDLPGANINACKSELESIGIDTTHLKYVSAKTGDGVKELLNTLVNIGKAAKIDVESPLQARIIDSWYDTYAGIVFLIRVFQGSIRIGDNIHAYHSKNKFLVKKIMFLRPREEQINVIESGDVGVIITATKEVTTLPGDVLYDGVSDLIPELQKNVIVRPIVYYTLYLEDSSMMNRAINTLRQYQLNDPAFTFTVENSILYGICFNCGFLGTLHCQIVTERLATQHDLPVCMTSPSVEYHVYLNNGERIVVTNHKQMPDETQIDRIEEPYAKCNIFIATNSNIGKVMDLCKEKRSINVSSSITETQVIVSCEIPLIELITNFNDKLKSITSGYASVEYEISKYYETSIKKLIVVINGNPLDDSGLLIHETYARQMAQLLAKHLKSELPRSQVATKIQIIASNNPQNKSKEVLASAEISAYRKDVIAKCYGGDISRKKKLLEKQKAGKSKRAGQDVEAHGSLTNQQWSKAVTASQADLE